MANPIISRSKSELTTSSTPMTKQGVIQKTSILLGVSTITALGFFFAALTASLSLNVVYMTSIASLFAGFAMALFITFKPLKAKTLAVPYSLLQGMFLGGISLIAMTKYPSVPVKALLATFVTAGLMLGLYRSGMVKVTEKFRSIVTSAVLAIMIVYAIQWVMSLFFSSSIPGLFDGGALAIGFSIFVIVIASFSLLLDFDNVDQGIAHQVSEDFEWLYSISILATLVWMYIEFLRLIGYLQD